LLSPFLSAAFPISSWDVIKRKGKKTRIKIYRKEEQKENVKTF
jgi:hypothetical protein